MKRIGLITFGVLVMLLLAGGAFLLWDVEKPIDQPGTDTIFPITPHGGGQAGEMQITLRDGTTATVPDFSKSDTRPNASHDNGYQVGGADIADYQILYFPDQSYFLISLQSEPLGEVRLRAEKDLREKTRLTNQEICRLNIDVQTPNDVSEIYSGYDLGASFCPGAVLLP